MVRSRHGPRTTPRMDRITASADDSEGPHRDQHGDPGHSRSQHKSHRICAQRTSVHRRCRHCSPGAFPSDGPPARSGRERTVDAVGNVPIGHSLGIRRDGRGRIHSSSRATRPMGSRCSVATPASRARRHASIDAYTWDQTSIRRMGRSNQWRLEGKHRPRISDWAIDQPRVHRRQGGCNVGCDQSGSECQILTGYGCISPETEPSFSMKTTTRSVRGRSIRAASTKRSNPRAAKHFIPSITGWHTTAGGIGAAPGKHGYTLYPFRDGHATFHISPVSSKRNVNHHLGYVLTAFGIPRQSSWVWIGPDSVGDHGAAADLHRSPQAAASAARKYYDRVMSGGSIYRANPKRSARR